MFPITVKATREGEIGKETTTGYIVDRFVPFVALPSESAKGWFVRISNPATGKHTLAIVLDVGPWNVCDDAYVIDGARPQAESGTDLSGRPTNGAGIDLGERVWHLLGMVDNGPVSWERVL